MDNNDIKKKAIEAFNKTWDYIDKESRTAEENLTMIDFAYKSKYYWSLVGTELHFVRSDWQVSRALVEANLLEAALIYSKSCLDNTLKNDFKDFDLFFAYEANVRVHHLLGNTFERDEYTNLARKSIEQINKKSDRDYCLDELNKILAK